MVSWSHKERQNQKRSYQGPVGVYDIAGKLRETRLLWYGHVQRREEQHVTKRVLNMELPGRRKQGRPKRRWRDCVREDMKKCGLTEADAQDCSKWKKSIRCGNP